jgi:hypothetical protein
MIERELFGYLWKYENDKLWRLSKTKKWKNFDDNKPMKNGYIQINLTIDGKRKNYYLHRLVYFFHNSDWNIHDSCRDNSIDHRNGNKLDNRVENLQNVTASQNLQNITHMNKKLIKGVNFHKHGRPKPWCAHWYEDKKEKSKSFATENEALEHRRKMMEKHYYCPRMNIE